MLVPAAHRTFESENLTGLAAGTHTERLSYRWLASGETARFSGPAAIVVLDGQGSITVGGRATTLSARSGFTIAGSADATLQAGSQGARILILEVLPGV